MREALHHPRGNVSRAFTRLTNKITIFKCMRKYSINRGEMYKNTLEVIFCMNSCLQCESIKTGSNNQEYVIRLKNPF